MQTISEPEAILPALASHVTNECHVLVLGGNQRDERERERERERDYGWHSANLTLQEMQSVYTLGEVSEVSVSHSVMFDSVTPWTAAFQAPLSMDSPGKNTGVGCHFLLQGIFPTQGLNPGFMLGKQILYH